jgi:hypothetical protein
VDPADHRRRVGARGSARGCHDIVIVDGIVFCSGLTGDVILDISGITDAAGNVRGEPLECETGIEPDGADTGALVTDCSMWDKAAYEDAGSPQADGLGVPRPLQPPGDHRGQHQPRGPLDEGVAVSHETRPLPAGVDPNDPDRRFMVVSDERGGAVVPGGANCLQEDFDEFWHGGLHFFDVTDPSNIEYATAVDGDGDEAAPCGAGQVTSPGRPSASCTASSRCRASSASSALLLAGHEDRRLRDRRPGPVRVRRGRLVHPEAAGRRGQHAGRRTSSASRTPARSTRTRAGRSGPTTS